MTYVILEAGPSDDPFAFFIQIGGVLSSVVTTARACTEWHVFTNFNSYDRNKNHEILSKNVHNMKALLFFVPHVAFKATATAIVVAFLKIHSFFPLTFFLIISVVITCALEKSRKKTDETYFLFPLSLFAPSVSRPESKFGWTLMKSTMLASTLTLIPCLIFIRLLPLLPPETISCTLGLSHLNHSLPIPPCSPCFNLTMDNSTRTACVMATTLYNFSTHFFLPLIILGAWCLFEGHPFLVFHLTLNNILFFPTEIALLCKSCRTWPLPSMWAEAAWLAEVLCNFYLNCRHLGYSGNREVL